jgi:hypothetical protein
LHLVVRDDISVMIRIDGFNPGLPGGMGPAAWQASERRQVPLIFVPVSFHNLGMKLPFPFGQSAQAQSATRFA